MLRCKGRIKFRNYIKICAFLVFACYGALRIENKIGGSYIRSQTYVIDYDVINRDVEKEEDEEFFNDQLKLFNGRGGGVKLKEFQDVMTYNSNITKETNSGFGLNNDKKLSTSQLGEIIEETEFPISPQDAVSIFGNNLNLWEHEEIFNYSQIWFLGVNADKTKIHRNSSDNYGFDHTNKERKGQYKIVAHDHIAYRYEILKELGLGVQATTVEAIDHSNNRRVAIKISLNTNFRETFEREIKLMKYIEEYAANVDYFSRMFDSFLFRNHSCIVMELMGSAVADNLKIEDANLMQKFIHDILHGMYYLHGINVFHSDFKQRNIMYIRGKNNQSEGQLLKLIDFGVSCIPGSQDFKCPDYYFQPRWCRAPESILCLLPVTTQSDMFGVGVMITTFILGGPPMAGRNEAEQLAAMMEVLGPPPPYLVNKSIRKNVFSEALDIYYKKGYLGISSNKHITKLLQRVHPLLFDLIVGCLEWDPNLRLTAKDALRHPYLNVAFMPTRR